MQEPNKNNKKLMAVLGKIIQRYRKIQRKSIYKISAEILMSKSTWREAELGICNDIKLTTLWKISEGLDIPLHKLLEDVYKETGEKFSLIECE